MKKIKGLLYKILIVAVVASVMLIIGYRQGKFFNYSFSENVTQQKDSATSISLEDAKYLFPKAAKISEDALKQLVVFDIGNKILGYIISSKPYSDSLVGFAGPVHFIMGIDKKNILVGIKLTEHSESPGYIDFITKEGFFEKLKNKSLESIVNNNIDAVSGASMTTNAVIKALKQKSAEYNKVVLKTKSESIKKKIKDSLSILILVFALLCFFTKIFKKFRLVLLIGSVLILGFLNGTFISLFLLHGWIQTGVPIMSQIVLASIVIISIVFPIIFNRSFYCDYLCPFGAVQELAGKIKRSKITVPYRNSFIVKHLREILFFIILILILVGINIDLTNFEPFSAFIYISASLSAIILAIVFIILSVFFNKPWCYYFCPTGQFLAFFKSKRKS